MGESKFVWYASGERVNVEGVVASAEREKAMHPDRFVEVHYHSQWEDCTTECREVL